MLGLSPETPFPGAFNETAAAYLDMVNKYGVDPKKIVTCKLAPHLLPSSKICSQQMPTLVL